ncbi:DUF898 domain-containing protein [Lysobacter pythonis]|uniref:DUF898 domain-containing protein n=1 Tax=Solilutibacter pythonis TaxID=2483112 RepID=A0A3M2HXK2_9GAMM|nr:YjgN family protein [Lysobacter pythonis]RMH94446.1 DUF898 domain-containing protein [Lysobacter pythonis]
MEYRIWPDAPSLPPGPPPLPESHHRPQFSGSAREFFGIWFVNLLLSILTLGIYSAWAKVRTERYFYSNTRLAGAAFEYIADPIAILKGRLIAYAIVIVLVLSSHFFKLLYLALIMLVFVAMPAFIVWSLRFRARNSLWRGLGFRFDQPLGDGYMPFFLWKILSSISLGLLSPVARMKQQEFVVEGHRYGVKRFRFQGELGDYYKEFLASLALGVAVMVGIGVLTAVIGFFVRQATGINGSDVLITSLFIVVGAFYLLFFVLLVFLRVRYTNLLWGNAALGPHRFESTLRAREVIWIYASNALAIVFSLGLAVPWAMIRLARYRARHWTLVAMGDLDDFVASSDMRVRATGAELVDALDTGFDFGL